MCFYWCCLFPKAGAWPLWVAGHAEEKLPCTATFCTVIFVHVMGSMKRRQGSLAAVEAKAAFHFTKAFAALSGNSLEGKKNCPVPYGVLPPTVFFVGGFLWGGDKKLKIIILVQWVRALKFMKDSLRYGSVLMSLLQQFGYHLFKLC